MSLEVPSEVIAAEREGVVRRAGLTSHESDETLMGHPGAPVPQSDLKIRILVVDDEPKVVKVIKRILEAHDFEVLTAFNGEEALLCAHAQRLDLILLDVVMPLMDGFEVLEKLKASSVTSRIPVVMVTSRTDTQSIFKSMDLMAMDYLMKPFDLDTLLKTVKRCAKLSPY